MPTILVMLIASFIFGVVISSLICAFIISRYKMKTRPTNYPLNQFAQMQLTESHDVFLRRTVTTRVIQNNKKK